VLARSELAQLQDDLWVLGCAAEDACADLADARSMADLRRVVGSLLDAIAPAVHRRPGE
jgi:hypothetical protein